MKTVCCASIGLVILMVMTLLTILVYALEYKEKIVKIIIILLLASLPAWGQQTWDYTGALMTGTSTGLGQPDIMTQITGDVMLAQALNPNQLDQVVTPTSFSFGGQLIPQETISVGNPAPIFQFSTLNGKIIDWTVYLYGYGPGQEATFISTGTGDHYTANTYGGSC